jgi:dihydroorotate dehydrogenase
MLLPGYAITRLRGGWPGRKMRSLMGPAASNLYARIIRPFLFRLDPELAHRITIAALALAPPLTAPADPPELATTVFGAHFPNPVGLAAGMDKDARALNAWNALGFGFAELGTITPRPQPGNPRPRMWRLPRERALINRLGFPGAGMEAAAARLERAVRRTRALRIGLNFGPNKDTPAERVAEDYAALTRRLARFADFIVVNVSSPNTPGLRDFQAPARIREIVAAVRGALPADAHPKPLLIKLAPDLDDAEADALCACALDEHIDGIVATNTTLAREEVGVSAPYPGGLSGVPLRERARKMIARVYAATNGKIAIIGVGGIASAEDALGHIRAGASLVELYTGMVYGGPGIIAGIKRDLARLLAREGFRSISEATGAAAK